MPQDSFGDGGALHAIFNPAAIAILGPTGPNSLGEKALAGLTAGHFERPIVCVDPQAQRNGFDVPVHRELKDVPTPVDLAVIVSNSDETLEAIDKCVAASVKGVVVLSGIDASAEERRQLHQNIRERLRRSRTKLIGPGCAVMNPPLGLNVSPGLPMPVAGNVAFIAQSGSLASAIIDWSHKGIVGFSAFVSFGEIVDVGWGNLIDYFGNDRGTRAILIHMESIANLRAFLSAARAVALQKPIILLKGGRTAAAARAFPWHRTCQVSDNNVFDAALRRVGVIRVDDIEDLFHVADVLSKQPRPQGPRLTIVSNAGAPGVLAADHAVNAGTLVPMSGDPSDASSNGSLSTSGARVLDVLGDGSSRPFLEAVNSAAQDPANHALLVVLVPQAMSDAEAALQGLLALDTAGKPTLLCLPGPYAIPAGQEVLLRACLPVFASIGSAVRTFDYLWRYSHDLKAIYETPVLHADAADRELRQRAGDLISHAHESRRNSLTEAESREVLAHYGIASRGVRADSDARSAGESDQHELQIGSFVDPEFGPVLWLDIGGLASDLMSARVTGLPPLNASLARRILQQSPLFDGLHRLASRNAIDLAALEATLVRLSQLIVEQPAIREVSINPLLVSVDGARAGGAHIGLHEREGVKEIPKPVFRPFPVQYVWPWTTRQGLPVTIRPIRAEDEPSIVEFHSHLSESAVYLRYFQVVKLARRTAHDELVRVCFADYDREMVLVAERREANPPIREILAIASLTKLSRRNHGEVAVLVTDKYQRHGLGRELVRRLVDVAGDERLDRVVAHTKTDNHGMCTVFQRLGFTLAFDGDDVKAELDVRVP